MRGGLGAKPKTVPDKILLACVLTLIVVPVLYAMFYRIGKTS